MQHPRARIIVVENRGPLDAEGGATRKLALLAELAADGRLESRVATVAPWHDAADVLDRIERRELSGRAVICIGA